MKTFETDIFPFRFCIAEYEEVKEVKETFVDWDGDEIMFPEGASGFVSRAKFKDSGKICSLIVINKREANIGTAAHEAFHSATDVLENVGIFHNGGVSEVYAYVIGFIAQKIYETIWE